MTTDLWMLAGATLLTWLLIMADATPSILGRGVTWAAGNRDDEEEPSGVHGRVFRTSRNMKENLPLFAAVVLIVAVAGQANSTSALGAQIFLGARIVHAIIYIAGVPFARTAVWGVSIVGMFMVASAMF